MLTQSNLTVQRTSKDTTINNEGNKLLELCKSNNLCILNGRCGADKNIGNFTFRNTSVIDYTITSVEALKFVDNFCISELDPLYTDGHSLLTTTLKFKYLKKDSSVNTNDRNMKVKPQWNEKKAQEFKNNIDRNKILQLNNTIEHAQNNVNDTCINDINNLCSEITNIFVESASKSFGINNSMHTTLKTNRPHKQWFGIQCQNARKNYHDAKRAYNINPSRTTKTNLNNCSKDYKKTLNFHINKYNRSRQEKLRNLKSNSPKEFWKILNNVEKSKNEANINLETLYDYFKNINDQDPNDDENFLGEFNVDITDDEELLNSFITEGEIMKCIKSLKHNKSSGNDNILNEYIKSTAEILLPTYTAFFNLILDTGLIPEAWLEGIICPIYKGKGNPLEPSNYRPITILSCFGKLFTAVLNMRLNNFLNSYDLLNQNQAGFRSGFSTNDHIFALHAIAELLKSKKQKLFCSFIDFSKAFDSVWRVGLWMKLLSNGINGKVFRLIYNLYFNIKSCVNFSGEQSQFFHSYSGVRQGENLSPVLFAIFLNDLEDYLVQNNCNGITLDSDNPDILLYLKLFVLLYADDTVVFGTDATSFQENLNYFYEYTRIWKLKINYDKTKIMIFGIRNVDQFEFRLGDFVISKCDEFKYLGVIFSKGRSFYKAMRHNVDQAKKALHLLYKRIRNLHLPIDLQLHLFDHTILPILLYGCEIWGYQNTKIIETVHNQFLRYITRLRKSTPIYMLYGELGRYPVEITIKTRMIGFWISVVNSSNDKISKILYNMLYNESALGHNFKWITSIKNILISVGRLDLFYHNVINNPKATKLNISRTLKDLNIQIWNSDLLDSSKSRNYHIFKDDVRLENYLLVLPSKIYLPLIKFRTANHKLPIERGRWENVPHEDRKCNLCDKNDIGDEFHYILICPFFSTERANFINPYFYTRPNILKYQTLLQSHNKKTLIQLSQFVNIIMQKFF